jgi:hypothetical protein
MFALEITLNLWNYNALAVTYIFSIIYYSSVMLICSSTPNGCLGELLVNKGRSHIGFFFFLPMGYQIKITYGGHTIYIHTQEQ